MKAKTTFALLAATIVFALLQPQEPAPDVAFATDLRGKVVLVTFWGTYCGPCLKEMPSIVEAHRKFAPRGYDTVAVAVRKDDPEKVAAFALERALPFQVIYDASGEIAREFGNVRITPSIFVLGRDGRVLAKAVGNPDWKALRATVEKAL